MPGWYDAVYACGVNGYPIYKDVDKAISVGISPGFCIGAIE
jgi:hypothetical protein